MTHPKKSFGTVTDRSIRKKIMIEKKKLPNRKRNRMKGYDYSMLAYYFVTICTHDKEKMFGKVVGSYVVLNRFGKIALQCWNDLPNHYSNCELDYYIIMPDHVHGIIIINECRHEPMTRPNKKSYELSEIVRGFKSFSSKRINLILDSGQKFHWQKSFYDRIIRNEKELWQIRKYIEQNPFKWEIENNLPENLEL